MTHPTIHTPLPLEDEPSDILSKALRLHHLPPIDLPPPSASGQRDAFIRDKLKLPPEMIASAENYSPHTPNRLPEGLSRYSVDFYGGYIHFYTLRYPHGYILIDTGLNPEDLRPVLEGPPLKASPLLAVLITHEHHDHIGGLPLIPSNIPVVRHPEQSSLLYSLTSEEWHIERVPGHTPDSVFFFTSYTRDGKTPLLFTGDTLFARSMGRIAETRSYHPLVKRLRSLLSSYPADTLILPGHGPLSTLDEELTTNPFLNALDV